MYGTPKAKNSVEHHEVLINLAHKNGYKCHNKLYTGQQKMAFLK
jgi:hypothetical protein